MGCLIPLDILSLELLFPGTCLSLEDFLSQDTSIPRTSITMTFLPGISYPRGLKITQDLWLKMAFCYQNYSDLPWEKIVLMIEKFFEITRTIYSNSERSEQFLVTEWFFNLFLEVSHTYLVNSNWKKVLGFRSMQEKLEKSSSPNLIFKN